MRREATESLTRVSLSQIPAFSTSRLLGRTNLIWAEDCISVKLVAESKVKVTFAPAKICHCYFPVLREFLDTWTIPRDYVLLISAMSGFCMLCLLYLQMAPRDLPVGLASLSESGLKEWEPWLPNISDRLFEANPIKNHGAVHNTRVYIFEVQNVPEIPGVFSTISTLCVVFFLFFFFFVFYFHSLTTSVKIKSQYIVLFYGSNPSRLISAMAYRSADVFLWKKLKGICILFSIL